MQIYVQKKIQKTSFSYKNFHIDKLNMYRNSIDVKKFLIYFISLFFNLG